jgi:hypothetical protein
MQREPVLRFNVYCTEAIFRITYNSRCTVKVPHEESELRDVIGKLSVSVEDQTGGDYSSRK